MRHEFTTRRYQPQRQRCHQIGHRIDYVLARPGTAAARWTRDFVRGPVVNERIAHLRERADVHSLAFRRSFVGEAVELLVEHEGAIPRECATARLSPDTHHGRCERYFDVHFDHPVLLTGRAVRVRIDRVSPQRTHGTLLSIEAP